LDNKIVWIALGAIAAIALIVILVVTMTSGDEGANADDPVEGATDYNDAIEADFIAECTQDAPAEQCQCAYDQLEANVPFDRYVELAEEDLSGATSRDDLPAELQAATEACSGAQS
jgi:hypothetical protein